MTDCEIASIAVRTMASFRGIEVGESPKHYAEEAMRTALYALQAEPDGSAARGPAANGSRAFKRRFPEVTALLYDGLNSDGIRAFKPGEIGVIATTSADMSGSSIFVPTSSGPEILKPGNWIVMDNSGSFEICTPDEFKATYEAC